jgi:large subunit ribosomal protein L1
LQLFDRQKHYSLEEAVGILKKMPPAKFNETVEVAFRLGVDPKQSYQVVRGAMVLPNGIGKTIRVAVVASGEAAQAATAAGADTVGFDDLIERIKGGWMEFDVLLATPAAMTKVRALGRVLGPRGLMPNPKTGTVTDNPGQAVREAKAGRIEYRTDKAGCVHVPLGKLGFEAKALTENAIAVIQTITKARPPTAKGSYLLSATLSATMSPGVRIDVHSMTKA